MAEQGGPALVTRFIKLKFRPGVDKEGTNYDNEFGWFDTDKVRFRNGKPEKIGGWTRRTTTAMLGTIRAMLPWSVLSGDQYIGVGTSKKLYIDNGSEPVDVTPIRSSGTLGTNPIVVTNLSTTITVNHTAHGAVVGDFVTLAGSAAVGGVLAATLNVEHEILTVPTADSWTATVATAGTSTATGGGASVTFAYQISVGLDTAVIGTGWGIGTWGGEAWGEASTGSTLVTEQFRLWTLENFGEDMIGNVYNGGIYQWDASSGTSVRAVNITSLAGQTDAPTVCRTVVVAAESRHLLAIGCNPRGSASQDTLLIRWADAETLTDWTPDTDNTAGGIRLSTGSEIIAALPTKRDTLIWTDASLNSLTYVGPPFFFGTRLLSTNVSIIGPRAAIEAGDIVYWMGKDNFYVYDGSVQVLPCTLREHVFKNINRDQARKTHVGINRGHSEIIWFYVATTDEITNYVIYNYSQKIWYHGTMVRTAWHDRTFTSNPIAAYTDGHIYYHEDGCDDGTTDPASAITATVESSDLELFPGDGHQYGLLSRLIPDVTFTGSSVSNPAVNITITPRNYPGSGFETENLTTVTRDTLVSVETFTKQKSIRIRGRAVRYKIQSTALGVAWRDGSSRVEARTDGRQ